MISGEKREFNDEEPQNITGEVLSTTQISEAIQE